MNRIREYLMILFATGLGSGSLLLFIVFVFAGPILAMQLGFSERGGLLWNTLLSLGFFAQHSLMVRRWFKDWLGQRVPPDFHGAIYATASGVALAVAMLFWQQSSTMLVTVPGVARWLLRAIAVLAIFGFIWGARALRTFDTFGREPLAARLHGRKLPAAEFVVRGPYQWVRHPLMFFMTILLWTNPDVTADRALFNVLWTTWMVLGAYWEERDLVAEFGPLYRMYQKTVPMLLPWRGRAGSSWTSQMQTSSTGTTRGTPEDQRARDESQASAPNSERSTGLAMKRPAREPRKASRRQ